MSRERGPVIVAAGVLIEDGRVLLTQRKQGTHLEGLWELPGGKVEPDEDPRDAVVRELEEELGLWVEVLTPFEVTHFRYPEKTVLLIFFEVRRKEGSPPPRALEVAALQFAGPDELPTLAFPDADARVVEKLRARLR